MTTMKTKSKKPTTTTSKKTAKPQIKTQPGLIQEFGTVVKMPIGLDEKVCHESIEMLNRILADTMTLRDMYKKHHWQVTGPSFYSLHLLFDKHYGEQAELVDAIAERIQILGGVTIAMGQDAALATSIPLPPKGREEVSVQLSRLLKGHEILLKKARHAACKSSELGDEGTNDLLISSVVRTNEMQVWFTSEHLVKPS